jgi:hypothetical protein
MAKAITRNHNLRISELIENGFNNSDIARLIQKEYSIYLITSQIDKKRDVKFLTKTKTEYETKTKDTSSKIEKIMASDNYSAKTGKEIREIFHSSHGRRLSKEEFNSIVWGPLKQKFNHCRVSWTYEWKRETIRTKRKATNPLSEVEDKLKDFNPFETLKNEARKNFIKVNSGNKKIDELIRTVVKDNRITQCEEEFLIQKTVELNLPVSLLYEATKSLHENNPYLDNLIHLVFEDGVITKEEIKFLKEKVIENEFNPIYFNVRFWQIGLIHYMDHLLKYELFSNIIKYWGINFKLKLSTELGNEFYFNALNIFESSSFESLLMKGEKKINTSLNYAIKHSLYKNLLLENCIGYFKSPSISNIEKIEPDKPLNSHINLLKTIINEEKRRLGSPQGNLLAENILFRIEQNNL